MYDFIKANLEVEVFDQVRKLTSELATQKYYPETGSWRSDILTYKNFTFENVLNIHLNWEGSLHKFKNDGKHNYDQFTIQDIKETLSRIENLFCIDNKKTKIHNLEFGVNLNVPFEVRRILDSIIIYKGKDEIKRFNGKGYLIREKHEQYEIKIYDKGMQYNTGTNILRFEIKVKTMQYLRSKGCDVVYLSDILCPVIQSKLGIILSKAVNNILVYPLEYDLTYLKRKDIEFFLKGRDKTYWKMIKPSNRKKKIKRLKEIFKIASTPEFIPLTTELVLKQWKILSGVEVEKVPNFIPSYFTHSYTSVNRLNRVRFFYDIPVLY